MADTKRNRLVFWGGGHVDYRGNEVYALDLNSLSVMLLTNATTNPNTSSCPESLYDGNPDSRHTYGGLSYLPTQDVMLAYSGSLADCGSFSNGLWFFDLTTLKWVQKNPPSPQPNPGGNGSPAMFAYDSVTDKVFEAEKNTGEFWKYDPTANTWTDLGRIGGCDLLDMNSAIDTVRRQYFCVGNGGFWKISLNAPFTTVALAGTNCGTLASVNAPGFEYDPVQKLMVGWAGGNTVYLYNPDTDSCTTANFTGGPPAEQNAGTYGRFRYFPALNVFALVNDSQQNAYALRLTNGTPPPPPPPGGSNDADFQARCSAPGVLACEGFDTAAKFISQSGIASGFYYDTSCPTWPTPCIQRDTSVFLSGGSSARWDIYGNTGPDAEGYWLQKFGNQTFTQNSTFYVQFAFRPDATWTTFDWTTTGPSGYGTAPKIAIFHGVDANGQPVTCDPTQFVISDNDAWDMPTMYSACSQPNLITGPDGIVYNENTSPLLLQQGFTDPAPTTGYDCEYNHGNKPTGPICLFFTANTWYTIYFKFSIGTWGSANTTIEAYAAPYGQQLRKFINVHNFTVNQTDVAGFSALTLTQFMTNKMTSVSHPTAHVWYDELIVSSQPIAQPGGSAPPPPISSPCDINGDGVVNVADVQLEVNMALGISPCTNPSGTCTVVSAQRVVNAALGGACVAP